MNQQMMRCSIFDNSRTIDGFSYIHIPLIYKTTNQLFFQMYAEGICTLLKITGIDKKIYYKQIENSVIEIAEQDINKIHIYITDVMNNPEFLKYVHKKILKINKELPELSSDFENYIAKKQTPPKKIFKKIYKEIVFAIAVNTMSFMTETFLPSFFKDKNWQNYNDYLKQNTFTHVKYLNDKKEKMGENIPAFCKNTGFLENEDGDKTKYEDMEYIKEIAKKTIKGEDIFRAGFEYPKIDFKLEYPGFKNIPVLIKWSKLFQNCLELRHYWMFRFSRDLRYILEYDEQKIMKWVYKDYEKEIFKV